ncbi:unnamed protein product [Cuscuta epithymum]|uniref:Uncharacterized protein n=1 Tax=Cuscuta epithymum TaxID=186058 RepID=A0AAV0G4D9_9ASTE|nr:unnamed protein product [Cuscuta epithymum]
MPPPYSSWEPPLTQPASSTSYVLLTSRIRVNAPSNTLSCTTCKLPTTVRSSGPSTYQNCFA